MAKKKRPLVERKSDEKTVYASYAVTEQVVKCIEKNAAVYGSLGRTIMVATEVLLRQKKPVKLSHEEGDTARKTYKLLPRTIAVIHRLAPVYGDTGRVLAACAKVLQEPCE